MIGSWFAHHPGACFGPGGRGHRHGRGPGGGRGGGHGGGGNPFGGNPFHGNPFSFLFRGRRASRGNVRAGILALLAEQPRNGYQIMQELEQRSRGMWRPSPGSVYPALQQLEDEGLVKAEEAGGGRVFALTERGRAHVKEHQDETTAPWDEVARCAGGEELADLLGLARQVGVAAAQVVHAGGPAQVAEARKVLHEARRALYRILAEEGPDSGR